MKRRPLVIVLALLLAPLGCGKEKGRLPFTVPTTGVTALFLLRGDVDFWTDIDIAYRGTPSLTYRIELAQEGKVVAHTVCNPLGKLHVKMQWAQTSVGESHTRSGLGKMSCSVKVPNGGKTEVRATLGFDQAPTSMDLKKADLVIRQ